MLPRDPSCIWGHQEAAGRGMGEQEREGKGRKEEEGGQARGMEGPLRLRIPGSIFYPSPLLPIIVN